MRQTVGERFLYELVRSCQDYCLSDAAVLLRVCILMGQKNDRVVRDAIEYFLSQQTPDGRFGYSAIDDQHPESTAFYLSWAVAVQWALMDFAFPGETATRRFSPSSLR
jgi:hypothetical protein